MIAKIPVVIVPGNANSQARRMAIVKANRILMVVCCERLIGSPIPLYYESNSGNKF
jgi:hypothetical protein